jgi:5-hydroxyisourate hydrolase
VITTHVLDVARGAPVEGLRVELAHRPMPGSAWQPVAEAATDADGRVRDWPAPRHPGHYRLTFATGDRFPGAFHPEVSVVVAVDRPDEHLHVPLLLSPFGYTTYRGS